MKQKLTRGLSAILAVLMLLTVLPGYTPASAKMTADTLDCWNAVPDGLHIINDSDLKNVTADGPLQEGSTPSGNGWNGNANNVTMYMNRRGVEDKAEQAFIGKDYTHFRGNAKKIIQFTGYEFWVHCMREQTKYSAPLYVTIDGVEQPVVDCHFEASEGKQARKSTVVFHSGVLENGTHTVILECRDTNKEHGVYLDALVYADDPHGVISFAADTPATAQKGKPFAVKLLRQGSSDLEASVTLAAGETEAERQTVTFAAGETEKTVSVKAAEAAQMQLQLEDILNGGVVAYADRMTVTLEEPDPEVSDAPEPWGALPTEAQMEYYHEGMSGFLHYGTNTFRNLEWAADGRTRVEDMKTTKDTLHTDQWVETFKNAGFGRVIYIAKHHDGFHNWHSTEYSTAQSAGKVDILEELSKSCTKYDMDIGVYMSPWDCREEYHGCFGNGSGTPGVYPLDDDYNKLYERHLNEIFNNPEKKYGNNGHFVELWLDGASGSKKHQTYDYKEWIRIAAENNPGILNFQGGEYQTLAYPENEGAFVADDLWSKVTSKDIPKHRGHATECDGPMGNQWVIWEGDVSIRPGWFHHPNQNNQVKSPEKLFQMYLNSVGHGGVFLLNIPPTVEGVLYPTDVENVTKFGEMVRTTFAPENNLAAGATVKADVALRNDNPAYAPANLVDEDYDSYWAPADGQMKATLEVDLGSPKIFDLVNIQEYIPLGQRINSYKIEIQGAAGWQEFGSGTVIGYKRLVQGPCVRAQKLRITVSSDYAIPVLNQVGVYKLPENLEEGDSRVPHGLKFINDKDMKVGTHSEKWQGRSDAWYLNRPEYEGKRDYIGNDITMICRNGYKDISFLGSKFYIRGARCLQNKYNTDMYVTIDGGEKIRVDCTTDQTTDPLHPFAGDWMGMILYTSPDLEYGQHTVRIEAVDKSSVDRNLLVDALIYCSNPTGMFEFAETGTVQAEEGKPLTVTVRRIGDASQPASVMVMPYPGSAVHGEDFEQEGVELIFAAGVREMQATFQMLENQKIEKDQYFDIKLEAADLTFPDSFNMELRAEIADNDVPQVDPDQEAAKAVDDKIAALGEITLDSEAAITEARAAYTALSDGAKAKVTKLAVLEAAEASLQALKDEAAQAEADKKAAKAVDDKIAALGEITLDSEAAITEARAAYTALSDGAKAQVTKLAVLEAAEASLQVLKDEAAQAEADKKAAKAVDDKIAAIGTVTLERKEAIEAARAAYDELTNAQKVLVKKLDVLEAAEAKLAQLQKPDPKPEPKPEPEIPSEHVPGTPVAPVKPEKPEALLPFTDVAENQWYFDDVKQAFEAKLIDGMDAAHFNPNGTLTIAQTIKLAAALHQRDKTGKVTLENGKEAWFSTYVDYAVANDVIEEAYKALDGVQMNKAITRSEFVKIFHGAMSYYSVKNDVADNAIPDVKMNTKNAEEIYDFYRAGILIGSDDNGTFYPESQIKRSEAAAILIRMFDLNARQAITMK